MSHPNKVKIRRIVVEPAPVEIISPFLGVGIRELARETGLDPSYLSRVERGLIPVTMERYQELVKAWERLNEGETQNA